MNRGVDDPGFGRTAEVSVMLHPTAMQFVVCGALTAPKLRLSTIRSGRRRRQGPAGPVPLFGEGAEGVALVSRGAARRHAPRRPRARDAGQLSTQWTHSAVPIRRWPTSCCHSTAQREFGSPTKVPALGADCDTERCRGARHGAQVCLRGTRWERERHRGPVRAVPVLHQRARCALPRLSTVATQKVDETHETVES